MEISKAWRHAAVLVLIVGFTVLIFMGRKVYENAPPIPVQVTDESGKVLFTGEDILAGQAVFQRYGLMDYGSVFGHGAYRGPDFTDDYLHRSAWIQRDLKSQAQLKQTYAALSDSQKAQIDQQVVADAKTNRYDDSTQTLTLTAEQAQSWLPLEKHYEDMFMNSGEDHSLPKDYIKTTDEVQQ